MPCSDLANLRSSASRLDALRRTELLDSPTEEAFDRLTRLASKLIGAPVTFISLVDGERDFYKSFFGFGEPFASTRQMEGVTFCHYALASPDPLVIPNARAHPLYCNVPTVQSLGVAAYLGIPLVTSEGHTLGSFCAIDFVPHEWSSLDIEIMQELAASTLREVELRMAARDAERVAQFQEGQSRILEMIASGSPLPDVLKDLVCFIEDQTDDMIGSILLLDPDGKRLRSGAAPNLPQSFSDALDGVCIMPYIGPCGKAAQLGVPVVSPSLQDDPDWSDEFKQLVFEYGLRACWSTPIFGSDGEVLGTFAFYYRSERAPAPSDLELIQTSTHLAGVAIQKHRSAADCNALLEDLQETIVELVTSRNEAERAREEAEAANAAKTNFLAVMSHDLRTPLNAISGYVDLMEMGVHGPTTPEQKRYLSRIRRSQEHLLALIEDILSFARLEAGRVTFNLSDVPVGKAIMSTHAIYEPQLLAKNIQFEYLGGPKDVFVRADRDRMEQVVLNLVTNAIKFSDSGSTIQLGWAVRPEHVEITVSDNGPGIPEDRHEAIFEPFTQAHEGLSRPFEGVGLGLAIARELAREMGGDLRVQSVNGLGSTFIFTLPLARTMAAVA